MNPRGEWRVPASRSRWRWCGIVGVALIAIFMTQTGEGFIASDDEPVLSLGNVDKGPVRCRTIILRRAERLANEAGPPLPWPLFALRFQNWLTLRTARSWSGQVDRGTARECSR